MTPERMAELVARWVRFYTRNLPAPVAERRVDEIDSDLYDHIAHERTHGNTDWRIALSIASRMVRASPPTPHGAITCMRSPPTPRPRTRR
jgi:hypothetical protein